MTKHKRLHDIISHEDSKIKITIKHLACLLSELLLRRLVMYSASDQVEKLEFSHRADGTDKWCSQLGKMANSFQKLNIHFKERTHQFQL